MTAEKLVEVLTVAKPKNNHQAVFEAALSLPESQRRKLAKMLAETLSTELDDYTDDEWLAELDRRHAEIVEGTYRAVPGSVLEKRLRKEVHAKGKSRPSSARYS